MADSPPAQPLAQRLPRILLQARAPIPFSRRSNRSVRIFSPEISAPRSKTSPPFSRARSKRKLPARRITAITIITAAAIPPPPRRSPRFSKTSLRSARTCNPAIFPPPSRLTPRCNPTWRNSCRASCPAQRAAPAQPRHPQPLASALPPDKSPQTTIHRRAQPKPRPFFFPTHRAITPPPSPETNHHDSRFRMCPPPSPLFTLRRLQKPQQTRHFPLPLCPKKWNQTCPSITPRSSE